MTRPLLLGIAVTMLAGCFRFGAQPLPPAEAAAPVLDCAEQDWRFRGLTEGITGAERGVVDEHLARCPARDEAAARTAFLAGYEEGLAEFCTPARMYELGRSGGSFRAVCPLQDSRQLHEAFRDGREIYAGYLRLRKSDQRLADIEQFSRVGSISERDRQRFGVEPRPDQRENREAWAELRERDNALRRQYDASPMPFQSRH